MQEIPAPLVPLTVGSLAELYVLDSLKGFGPQKFKQLYEAKIPAGTVLRQPELLPVPGKRGDPLREQIVKIGSELINTCQARAEKQLSIAKKLNALILTYGDPLYPKQVYASNNSVPLLYVRGNADILKCTRTIACVGSRKIRAPYSDLHARFARVACNERFTIVSGFALGADTIGHTAAVDAGGTTICVMPSGLDRPFPPENKDLWQRFLESRNAVFVSEFPFGTGAASLNLRKRNKLITAFALGVLVSQTASKGGAMNAYRFAIEQKKPIATFEDDGVEDSNGNRDIALATKPKSTVFHRGGEYERDFVSWLRALSSST
jgi:DNA protecting protein DprA